LAVRGLIEQRLHDARTRWQAIDDGFEAYEKGTAPLPDITAKDMIWASNAGMIDKAIASYYWQHHPPQKFYDTLTQLPPWYAAHAVAHCTWIDHTPPETSTCWADRMHAQRGKYSSGKTIGWA